jgi:hypothetical protein
LEHGGPHRRHRQIATLALASWYGTILTGVNRVRVSMGGRHRRAGARHAVGSSERSHQHSKRCRTRVGWQIEVSIAVNITERCQDTAVASNGINYDTHCGLHCCAGYPCSILNMRRAMPSSRRKSALVHLVPSVFGDEKESRNQTSQVNCSMGHAGGCWVQGVRCRGERVGECMRQQMRRVGFFL